MLPCNVRDSNGSCSIQSNRIGYTILSEYIFSLIENIGGSMWPGGGFSWIFYFFIELSFLWKKNWDKREDFTSSWRLLSISKSINFSFYMQKLCVSSVMVFDLMRQFHPRNLVFHVEDLQNVVIIILFNSQSFQHIIETFSMSKCSKCHHTSGHMTTTTSNKQLKRNAEQKCIP